MQTVTGKVLLALRSRLARNIYLWVVLLYVVLNMNYNNEQHYHYGIIYSSWYYPIIIIGTLLQMTLLYVNNLVLAPRYLGRRRRVWLYVLLALLLTFTVSLVYTFGLRVADKHLEVDNLQQIGFVSSPINGGWTLGDIWADMSTYLVGNLLWVFIFTMAWYMNDYYRQQRMLAASEKKRIETELHFLKSQINPHFLFNTLNNIYGLSMKKADETPDVILKLSSILRYILYESNTELVSFEREKEVMQAYIDLELIRLPNLKDLNFRVESDMPYHTPPLLWLTVLENVFKHGTRYIADSYFINFHYIIASNRIEIFGQNQYKQTTNGEQAKAGGIGLANLRKRLELLYPGRHTIDITKDEKMYTIKVQIELI